MVPNAIATAIATVLTMVRPGYRASMRRPTLKSSEEKRSERRRATGLFITGVFPVAGMEGLSALSAQVVYLRSVCPRIHGCRTSRVTVLCLIKYMGLQMNASVPAVSPAGAARFAVLHQ